MNEQDEANVNDSDNPHFDEVHGGDHSDGCESRPDLAREKRHRLDSRHLHARGAQPSKNT